MPCPSLLMSEGIMKDNVSLNKACGGMFLTYVTEYHIPALANLIYLIIGMWLEYAILNLCSIGESVYEYFLHKYAFTI